MQISADDIPKLEASGIMTPLKVGLSSILEVADTLEEIPVPEAEKTFRRVYTYRGLTSLAGVPFETIFEQPYPLVAQDDLKAETQPLPLEKAGANDAARAIMQMVSEQVRVLYRAESIDSPEALAAFHEVGTLVPQVRRHIHDDIAAVINHRLPGLSHHIRLKVHAALVAETDRPEA